MLTLPQQVENAESVGANFTMNRSLFCYLYILMEPVAI